MGKEHRNGSSITPLTTDYTVTDKRDDNICYADGIVQRQGRRTTSRWLIRLARRCRKVTVGGVTRNRWGRISKHRVVKSATAPRHGRALSPLGSQAQCPLSGRSRWISDTFPTSYASQVQAMKYAELYNGAQDSASLSTATYEKAFYSGRDTGHPPRRYWLT
jgi:hypothetical protein